MQVLRNRPLVHSESQVPGATETRDTTFQHKHFTSACNSTDYYNIVIYIILKLQYTITIQLQYTSMQIPQGIIEFFKLYNKLVSLITTRYDL